MTGEPCLAAKHFPTRCKLQYDWRGAPGWGKVLLIRDLSSLVSAVAGKAADQLFAQWQQHAAKLELGPGAEQEAMAEQQIDAAIEALRAEVLAALAQID